MASVTSLGRVQPLFKGAYSSSITYHRLDNVYYNGNTYVCQVESTSGIEPYEGSNVWQIIAAKGSQGDRGYTGGFGTPTGTVTMHSADNPTATINITTDGPDTAKIFGFNFDLPRGPKGFDTVSASATAIQAGANPSVKVNLVQDASTSNWNLGFQFDIPAASGEGIKKIDGSLTPDGQGNLNYYGVRYVGQTLSDSQKQIARDNIKVVALPTTSMTIGDYLQYQGLDDTSGEPKWATHEVEVFPGGGRAGYFLKKTASGREWAPVNMVPAGGVTNAVLAKLSDTDYDLTWTSITSISNNDIDTIVSDN